MKNSDWHHLGH